MRNRSVTPTLFVTLLFAPVKGIAQIKPVDFAREVQPILAENCYICHGAVEQKAGLRLDRRESAMRVAVLGSGGVSELVRRITSKEAGMRMPPWPTALSLSPGEIDTLKNWSAVGAPWPSPPALSAASVRLFDAIDRGDITSVRSLLRDRSVVNAPDTDGATPLMHAVLNAGVDSVRLLLGHGADPNARNNAGATALMWAVDDGANVSELLKAGADVNARSNHGTTPLIAASLIWGNSKVVAQLVAKGADVNVADSDGWTPLTKAASAGDIESVRLLIAKGAKTDHVTSTFTPLTAAAWYGHLDVVRLLLENGAGVNTKDANFRMTPLAVATLFDRDEIVKTLIEKGADVNVDTEPIWALTPGTPLMIAAYTETLNPGLTKLLLAHGSKAGFTTPDGQTALSRAKQKGDTEVVRALVAAGAPDSSPSERTKPVWSDHDIPDVRTAVERSLALLQKSDVRFFDQTACKSCHNQSLPAMAFGMARERGFRFDEARARRQSDNVLSIMTAQREKVLQMMDDEGPALSGGYALAGLAAMGYPGDSTTAAFARGMAARQLPAGNWHVESGRPPLEYSSVSATAFAIRTLLTYGPERRKPEYRARTERAKSWLQAQQPRFTEERIFQLLGLAWAKGDPAILQRLARTLTAEQREDGGWAQLSTLPSDAYATGQALYALNQAGGIAAQSAEYRRGVEFLRRTQLENGSWFVKTRAVSIQPYFESGFPHGKDQFISAAGTSWAAMALMLTEPAATRRQL